MTLSNWPLIGQISGYWPLIGWWWQVPGSRGRMLGLARRTIVLHQIRLLRNGNGISRTLNLFIFINSLINCIHLVKMEYTGHFIWVYKFVINTGGRGIGIRVSISMSQSRNLVTQSGNYVGSECSTPILHQILSWEWRHSEKWNTITFSDHWPSIQTPEYI